MCLTSIPPGAGEASRSPTLSQQRRLKPYGINTQAPPSPAMFDMDTSTYNSRSEHDTTVVSFLTTKMIQLYLSHGEPHVARPAWTMADAHPPDPAKAELLAGQSRPSSCAYWRRAPQEHGHDIDVKDAKFSRPETPGLAAQIAGLALLHRFDMKRLARGAELFEELLTYFAKKRD